MLQFQQAASDVHASMTLVRVQTPPKLLEAVVMNGNIKLPLRGTFNGVTSAKTTTLVLEHFGRRNDIKDCPAVD